VGVGFWVGGCGVGLLVFGPHPQPPNPHSPIPNPQSPIQDLMIIN